MCASVENGCVSGQFGCRVFLIVEDEQTFKTITLYNHFFSIQFILGAKIQVCLNAARCYSE